MFAALKKNSEMCVCVSVCVLKKMIHCSLPGIDNVREKGRYVETIK